jgi:hypothetical protein
VLGEAGTNGADRNRRRLQSAKHAATRPFTIVSGRQAALPVTHSLRQGAALHTRIASSSILAEAESVQTVR